MLLLVTFFREVAESRDRASGGVRKGKTLAQCLQHAQKTIYALTRESALRMLRGIQDEIAVLKDRGAADMTPLGRTGAINLRRTIDDMETGLLDLEFKHPYYWGSFSLVGRGDLRLF